MVNFCRFDILLVSLDPSQGAEIKKTRPCVMISPDEMNRHLKTLIVAPMTTNIRSYPSRVTMTFEGQEGNIVLDQIRTIDKSRIIKKLGTLEKRIAAQVLQTLGKIFS